MLSATFLLECLLPAGMRDVVTAEPKTGGSPDDVFVAEAELHQR